MCNYYNLKRLIIVGLLFAGVMAADSLHDAAEVGDLATVNQLLASGADVNTTDDDGVTALMIAAQNGHEVIVSALLSGGADVNAQFTNGVTALTLAQEGGHSVIVELLQAATTP